MIKHIVMWTFAKHAEGADKATNLETARARLSDLNGLVPGMHAFEPVIPGDGFESTYDLVLYSEFDTPADLKAYATHPAHVTVAEFIGKVRTSRACMDYEV